MDLQGDQNNRTSSGTVVKNLSANARDERDTGVISVSGRSPGEGNGYPLYYSWLGNPKDRETRWITVHRVTKESDMT